ncbi:uncharacterized protein LOC135396177 isoform X2 [Ornithodoros turicata]|uniref:uncharacterized protein LOC135396177 isoform X2 n=1 Tax=Ornithodoros turicata TaxID=34597 RepID=UPI003139DBF9
MAWQPQRWQTHAASWAETPDKDAIEATTVNNTASHYQKPTCKQDHKQTAHGRATTTDKKMATNVLPPMTRNAIHIKPKVLPTRPDPLVNITAAFHEFNVRLTKALIDGKLPALPLVYDEENSWKECFPMTFIFSAFLERDSNGDPYVLVVSIVQNSGPIVANAMCIVRNKTYSIVVPAGVKPLPEDHEALFTASYFICRLNGMDIHKSSDLQVTITDDDTKPDMTWIPVLTRGKISNEFAVCMQPTYGRRTNLVQMAEFIAYYTVIGVTRFTFYAYDMSPAEEQLLLRLRERKHIAIVLLRWNIPTGDVHTNGQMAAMQDCIHRERFFSEYVLNVDIDEFIVPKIAWDLHQAIELLGKDRNYGSFTILHRPFCVEYRLFAPHFELEVPLVTRVYTMRNTLGWPLPQRSKWIGRSKDIETGGVHFVWGHEKGKMMKDLNESQMVLHHYRSCLFLTVYKGANGVDILQNGNQASDSYITMYLKDTLDSDVFEFVRWLLRQS